eukprot:403363634
MITTQLKLDIALNFNDSIITGTNLMQFKSVVDKPRYIVLDFQDIKITKVEIAIKNGMFFEDDLQETTLFEEQYDKDLDTSALIVFIDKDLVKGDQAYVRLTYTTLSTTRNDTALNWLNASQTATQQQKYFYAQCNPHCRSLAPLQDTPSVRLQYSISFEHTDKLLGVSSGKATGSTWFLDETTDNYKHGEYYQFFSTSSIAFTLGSTENRHVIPNSKVDVAIDLLSEKSGDILDNYAGLLKDHNIGLYVQEIDTYLNVNDDIKEKYHQIVVHPPSYPFAAINNNNVLTVSPSTLIDGTQQQLRKGYASKWFGTFVSSRDQQNTWLNDGFSTFVARKALKNVLGQETAIIESYIGDQNLQADIKKYGADSTFSSLYPVITGKLPQYSFSQVSSEKGFQFLTYLESLVGETNFQVWMRLYFTKFLYQSISYNEMKAHFIDWVTNTLFKDNQESIDKVLNAINWEAWIKQGGQNPPEWNISFSTDQTKISEKLADDYIALQGTGHPKDHSLKDLDFQNMVIFLNRLITRQNELNYNIMALIDFDKVSLLGSNPEIMMRWLPLAISMGYEEAYGDSKSIAHKFVSQNGRMDYIYPIYQQLVRSGRKDLAFKWFSEFKNFYHPSVVADLKKMIISSIGAEQEDLLE